MIRGWDPKLLLGIGLLLLFTGFILPVLMIMRVLPSTFFLNFLSYTASFVGLVLGMLGAMLVVLRNRR